MKQVFQSLEDGTTSVVDVPAPRVIPGHVLIRTQASIVSAGTERTLVDFGRANLLNKARQQPDRVKDVVDKVRNDGLSTTVNAVRSKLGQPITLGYANAGIVLEVGAGVTDLAAGDAVATNGPHAEVVSVARNLIVRVPERDGTPLPAEEAAFAPIGAIALQGIRLAAPTIGERVVVTGLGLIGLLTVQLLRAHGCRVLGVDLNRDRLDLARSFGAETVDVNAGADPVAAANVFSEGQGVDAVIVTASTKSSEPMHQAAAMCRKRGRIVLVGVVGLDLQRADLYEKELNIQVSCSYGPGRYDPAYEDQGQDYPLGFVRWTAGRNFEAFLNLVADGLVDVSPLIRHRFALDEAATAYTALSEDPTVLGTALLYPDDTEVTNERLLARNVHVGTAAPRLGRGQVAVIGAGNYTRQTLLPALVQTPAVLDTIVSQGGASSAQAAHRFGFQRASTDLDAVFANEAIDTVFIATRHDSHAALTVRALEAGKHVYVEKPLALHNGDLDRIIEAYEAAGRDGQTPVLMVGFNRRFSRLALEAQSQRARSRGPVSMGMTVNAGAVSADHWVHDPDVGGGRIVGEACHFVDLARFLAGSPITTTHATYLGTPTRDTAAITLGFEDGSVASIQYFANGTKDLPKERLELFAGDRIISINNFRSMRVQGRDPSRVRLRVQDKGHQRAVFTFIRAVQVGLPTTPIDEFVEVSRATFDLARRSHQE